MLDAAFIGREYLQFPVGAVHRLGVAFMGIVQRDLPVVLVMGDEEGTDMAWRPFPLGYD